MEEVIKEIENISITNILPNFIKKMTEKQLEDEIKIILQSDQVLEIPQVGTKHSLNVSVAAGIILWDFYQKTEI